MRLLLVTQDFPPDVGGIQTYAAELAPKLAERTDHFAVLAPQRPGSEQIDTKLSFPVLRVPVRPDLLPLAMLTRLPGLVRRERFDAILHAQWQTAIASTLARRLSGYPRAIVSAAHGRELLFNPFSRAPAVQAYNQTRKWVLGHIDAFTPVSSFTGRLLQNLGVPSEKVRVVTNGTDPDLFRPMDDRAVRERLGLEGKFVILTVSRLIARKGGDTVIQALPEIVADVPNVTFVIIGEGPFMCELERQAQALRVEDYVLFLGRIPHEQLPIYYNTSDVFVLPSREEPPEVEGLPISFLEAEACGKPVIGARSGGIPDAVLEGETGLLVPPDDPQALGEAVLRLAHDPEYARRLGRQGREYVLRRGNWEYAGSSIFEVLQRALVGIA
ncbi:MAG TPA: glycosyltransferase family 4 protein [Rhodothermales bacterium]|nr:glycosyltransferase family 4 protein [Rhodothermales bacterium]